MQAPKDVKIENQPHFGNRLIAVEGVIGAGKTSLVRSISSRWHAPCHFEVFEENPFLTGGFYENQKAMAFNTEIFFLLSRFRQMQGLKGARGIHFVDYFFEKSRIFAHQTLSADERKIFDSVYNSLAPQLRTPDLVVFLKADVDTLLRRIFFRDRRFERSISTDYIERLILSYHEFFDSYTAAPVLQIDVSELDFVGNPEDFRRIATLIEDRLSGQIQLSLISGGSRKEAHA